MSELTAAQFLENPRGLRDFLNAHGTFELQQYPTGMFPASPHELSKETGMGMSWFRDSALITDALYEDGQVEVAASSASAMLTALVNNEKILDQVIAGNTEVRLPVRFEGETLANDTEPRRQNDSTGYVLWIVGKMANDGELVLSQEEYRVLAKTVDYLAAIEYWRDADEGHWEEGRRIQIPSIGVCIAGLREMHRLLCDEPMQNNIQTLIQKGYDAIETIENSYGTTDIVEWDGMSEDPYPAGIHTHALIRKALREFTPNVREYDAAMLFLVEPLDIFDEEKSRKIVRKIEKNLEREKGFARYPGDTYWCPRFPHIMSIEERTSMAEGRLDMREQLSAGVYATQSEAQWTIFDPMIASYWGKSYEITGDPSDKESQIIRTDRSLDQLVKTEDGLLKKPEAYYKEYIEGYGNVILPNENIPLNMATAALLRCVGVFERTTK